MTPAEKSRAYRLRKSAGQIAPTKMQQSTGQPPAPKKQRPVQIPPASPNPNPPSPSTSPGAAPIPINPTLVEIQRQSAILGWEPDQLVKVGKDLGILTQLAANVQADKWHYKRPGVLFEHQNDFIRQMKAGNCMVVGMRQFTGKTTGTHFAAFEQLWEHDGWSLVMLAPTYTTAKELFRKAYNDELIYNNIKPAFRIENAEEYVLENKSRFNIAPCNADALSGPTRNIIWLEEIHKTVESKEGREALAHLLPQAIRKMLDGRGSIWITCNQSNSRYFHAIKTILMKWGSFFPVCEISEPMGSTPRQLVILNAGIPGPDMSTPEAREIALKKFMAELLTAFMDAEFAKAQIENIADFSKDPFNPELIEKAFDGHNAPAEYTTVTVNDWSGKPHPVKIPANLTEITSYADPGFVHATGFYVIGRDARHKLHELWAEQFFGGQITEADLKQHMTDVLIALKCRSFYVENNSGGLWWGQDMTGFGFDVHVTGFGTSNPKTGDSNIVKFLERDYYNRVLKHLLESDSLDLASATLKSQWLLYDPTGKDKEAGKGDLMDCLLQSAFYCAGGIAYLQELMQNVQKKLDIQDDGAYSPTG